MIAETDLMWNGKLIKAGETIEKSKTGELVDVLIAVGKALESADLPEIGDEPAAKGKAK